MPVTDWQLKINNQVMDLTGTAIDQPRVNPQSLIATIDGDLTFTFTEDRRKSLIQHIDQRSGSFHEWDKVELYYQNTRIFWGRIVQINYTYGPIHYTCAGPKFFMSLVTAGTQWKNGVFMPAVILGDRSLVNENLMESESKADSISGQTFTLWYMTLRKFLPWLITQHASQLQAYGLTATVTMGNLANDPVRMDQSVQYRSRSLSSVIDDSLGVNPRYRVIPDCTTLGWRVIDLLDLDEIDIQDRYYQDRPLTKSIQGCATSVTVSTMGEETEGRTQTELTPAWNRSLEQTWDVTKSNNSINGENSPMAYVFRRFSYGNCYPIDTMRMDVILEIDGPTGTEQRMCNIAQVDTNNQTLMLSEPAITHTRGNRCESNLIIPGKARSAARVFLNYWDRMSILPQTDTAGPDGLLYQLIGTTIERHYYVESQDFYAGLAQDILNLIKDPYWTGELIVAGAPNISWWRMSCKYTFTDQGVGENIEPFISELVYDFASDTSTVRLSTDKRAFSKLAGKYV